MTRTRRRRSGFTLIEVMVALVILSVVGLGLATSTAPLMRMATTTRVRTLAGEVANARIAEVRVWPDYAALETTFADTVVNWPQPGWTRTTVIARVGGTGQTNDYKRITVSVVAPSLVNPIQRSITVAAP